jgi:Toastrack DUF4097
VSTLVQPAPRQRRTPAPIRHALFAVGALLAIAMIGFSALSLLDLAARHTVTERAAYAGVESLVVAGDGDVRITGGGTGGRTEVTTRLREGLWSPSHSATRDGGTLRLGSHCPAAFGDSCHVRYEIRVPSSTPVQVRTGAGDIAVADLDANSAVELETSAGDISASSVAAPRLTLKSAAGDIDARTVSAPRIELRSSAGDVSAELGEPADRLLAETSAGDISLLVPDLVYRVDASSSAGDVDDSGMRTSPDAPRLILARSGAGDVRVAARR